MYVHAVQLITFSLMLVSGVEVDIFSSPRGGYNHCKVFRFISIVAGVCESNCFFLTAALLYALKLNFNALVPLPNFYTHGLYICTYTYYLTAKRG